MQDGHMKSYTSCKNTGLIATEVASSKPYTPIVNYVRLADTKVQETGTIRGFLVATSFNLVTFHAMINKPKEKPSMSYNYVIDVDGMFAAASPTLVLYRLGPPCMSDFAFPPKSTSSLHRTSP